MAFVKCNGLTVHGATLAYPPSQFAHTQGTVIGVGNAAGMRQLMVQVGLRIADLKVLFSLPEQACTTL